MEEYWNFLFGNMDEPCYIAKASDCRLVYLNKKMEELLGKEREVLGKKFYDVIQNNTEIGQENPEFNWEEEDIFYNKIYDETLNMSFDAGVSRVWHDRICYLYIKCIPVDKKTEKDFNFELAMSQCAGLLLDDEERKLQGFLELLGRFYRADKTYLFEIKREKQEITCSNYWVRDPNSQVVQQLEKVMEADQLLGWLETRNEVNIIEVAENISEFSGDLRGLEVLRRFQIENIIIYVFLDPQQEPTAVLAVTNRRNMTADFRLLQGVARFLEMDLSKSDLSETVQELSDRDLLTGFYSRISYSQYVEEITSTPPKTLGVVFANVNGLKRVNSEYGYAKGDSYIKKATEMLRNHFETEFYRISGDEFVAFYPDVEKDWFETLVVSMRESLLGTEQNYLALGHAWRRGLIVPIDMVKEADTVMYINKQEYYHDAHRSFHDINDSTLADLLSYIANREFMIYLQPQVHLHDGSLYGAEALIRRFDKTNEKMVFPDQFIPLYEKKSVIRHVDIFVVEEVCRLLAEWYLKGVELPISVNLSRVTLLEYGIVDTIAKICDKYSIPRHLLVIEVTERVGLIENNVASSLIVEFVKQGFHISLDDFGCAYSNIVTLSLIDVDEVKLDKSLVDNLVTNAKNRVLVRNVLRMCNELEDTSTLAEGIEYAEQGTMLHALGCQLGQGYFYSRPIPVDEFCEKYINK